MKGLVLAAGDGGRLRSLTLDTPKVLLDAGGHALIHYPLNALRLAGITEVAVVVGYQAGKLGDALAITYPDVTLLYNEDYDSGNALSIGVAREFVGDGPFVLCMGDHPISPEIVERLLAHPWDGCVLCIDPEAAHPAQLNDATRVLVDQRGQIDRIGKDLQVWNAIDTGVFKMTSEVFPVIDHLVSRRGMEVSISDVVRHMGANGQPFATCVVTGSFWSDVDTADDYAAVVSLLG